MTRPAASRDSLQTSRRVDPLPRRYLTADQPGIAGRIKVRPADFLVEELPLYEPCGSGEHLYLFLEKERVSHSELLGVLRRHFGVPPRAIGFAGMKDKMGLTRQLVSIHTHEDPPEVQPTHDRVRVLWAARHGNKLRRGHLRGNRFSIRIRDVDPFQAPRVLSMLKQLERSGLPCYFDAQRFGYRANNHILGAALLLGDHDGVLSELLGAGGSTFPEYQRERREQFDAGAWREALQGWTPADRAELIALQALVAGRSPAGACKAIGRTTLSFWVSALQSAVFNQVLDGRLDDGTFDTLMEGDLAWKHDSRAVFAVTAEELDRGVLHGRLQRLEVSPSGPLWGKATTRAAGRIAEAEQAALTALGMTVQDVTASAAAPEGSRRPLREIISNIEVDGGVDEHGAYIRTAFDLPRGVYATIAMREIMK